MDELDYKLLNIIQNDFPVDARPYEALGEMLKLSEEEVIRRVGALKDSGIIRRVGAVFDPRKLGFISVLAAAEVPQEGINAFADILRGFHEITHIYERDALVNVWFTVSAPSRARLDEILADITSQTGIEVHLLPAEKIYKVKVVFQF